MKITQIPASPHNFTSGRGGHSVNRVIVHVQDGTQQGSISWFQNPASTVSAHYLISMAGEVVQMVHPDLLCTDTAGSRTLRSAAGP